MSDLNNRFDYHPPKDEATKQAHETVRSILHATAVWMEDNLPGGREQALVITKLEEAMFWANAAIARNNK